MSGFHWHEEEVVILKDMVEKGATIDDLTLVFTSRSKSSIRQKIEEMGLVLRTPVMVNMTAYEQFLATVKEQEKVTCLKSRR